MCCVEIIDQLIEAGVYSSRGECIRDIVRSALRDGFHKKMLPSARAVGTLGRWEEMAVARVRFFLRFKPDQSEHDFDPLDDKSAEMARRTKGFSGNITFPPKMTLTRE